MSQTEKTMAGKERPILFSAPMVRALLAGAKTQTRRLVRGAPDDWAPGPDAYGAGNEDGDCLIRCPYGTPGDRLWVKETYHTSPHFDCLYRADYEDGAVLRKVTAHGGWKPSIFMPRHLSRLTLEITGVRAERLQDIGRGDAMAEGCPFPNMAAGDDPRDWYAEMWRTINGAASWDANPWVWVVEFSKTPNV